MSEYRFQLQKYKTGTKITCPQCRQKSCFTRYIDTEGTIIFPDYVGRCDRENNCGYHYTPKQYFDANPTVGKQRIDNDSDSYKIPIKPCVPPQPKPVSFVDESIVQKTLSQYETNRLYQWLSCKIGRDKTDYLFGLYRVGTARKWGGSTVFWQTDINGKVRDGKLMLYDASSGKRVKQPIPHITWVSAELRFTDFNRRQCLFGEHLLPLFPNRSVVVVESEKTAIVGAAFMGNYVWIATGGKYGSFNRESMSVLRNREVILIPDLNAEDSWRIKASECLNGVARSFSVSDVISKEATAEQIEEDLDIADFLLMEETEESILESMIARNPNIRTLIDELGLELVSAE